MIYFLIQDFKFKIIKNKFNIKNFKVAQCCLL